MKVKVYLVTTGIEKAFDSLDYFRKTCLFQKTFI